MSDQGEFIAVTAGRRWRLWLTIALGLLAAVGLVVWQRVADSRAKGDLAAGRQYLLERRDHLAEAALENYLRRFPEDSEAILLWAQAVVSGRGRAPEDAARLAMQRLSLIPDQSKLGAEARMREGRLALLVLQQPDLAERKLRRSLELDSTPVDAHYLMWKLYDLTERFQYAEPYFWSTLERTPKEMRPGRLADWYFSQFSPNSGNAELDRRMGFLPEGQYNSDDVVLARLKAFQEHEPQAVSTATARAAFLVHLRDRETALQVLEAVSEQADAAGNMFFLATWIDLLLDLGRLDDAKAWFARWGAAKDHFLYHRTAARVLQIVDRDDQAAISELNQALQIWPGPVDWSLLHFRAQSEARLGQREAAERSRARAKEIEVLMELEAQQPLRRALLDLSRADNVGILAEFYRQLDRPREVEAWKQLQADLPSTGQKVY